MSKNRVIDSLGRIDDDMIQDVEALRRKKKRPAWIKWAAMAACLCIVLAGMFNQLGASPFILTAYAMEPDNSLSAVTMQEGKSVPVSTFKADNGMLGFVFSHKAKNPEQPISVSIIRADFSSYIMSDSWKSMASETIEAISRLDMERTQQYIFFVPSQGEPAPYNLTITMHDERSNTVALLSIVIEQENESYIARIDAITTYGKIENIDERLRPYQEVLDRLNEEYGYGLYIPEDEKFNVYISYKDMTQEAFETEIMKELEESASNGMGINGSGEMYFEYFDTPSRIPSHDASEDESASAQ